MHNGAEYTHICLLCLQQNEWKDSLCRARHTSNAKDHLVSIHREHEWAIKEQEHRSNRTKRLEVKVSPKEEAKRSAEPDDHAQQPDKRQKKLSWEAPVSKDKVSGHIVRWLIHDGLPRNLTTTPAFKEFLAGVTGKSDVTIPSHRTYNAILDNHYSTFKKNVAALISEEFKEVFQTPFMNVEHDLWTNAAKSCVVGASCSFIDHTWRPRHLAMLAQVKNDGHTSEEVAAVLDKELKVRYGLDVDKMARFTVSDTASTARKVSRLFDSTLQTDCTMHALNLCIGYGIGLKENLRNDYVLDPKSQTFVKKRVVVTMGGAFPEGSALIQNYAP
ncbi:hypothetical protein L914_11067 [Phytophthora nicotianae]|uniref:DUF659 domain-containing protein n=2 Tax=Phytophthora nicotianae TaxID=4792 RepID=V9EZN1_PHYNI|nr:hypothetical protein F443_11548 [Phytophthora nicotianae P1569]ETM43443.1 hypothetical protein L914_11067 [Phytophthora nicotianae]